MPGTPQDSTKGTVANVLSYLLFGLHGLLLLFKLPSTLRTLWGVLRPNGSNITDGDFWAFSHVDAGFRPWYGKIARAYRSQGRFGYVWDDGLGMPLGARIYNNMATYWLLAILGTRRMALIGLLLIVSTAGVGSGLVFGVWVGVGVALLALASPLLIASYTHLGKPEVFWWWAAIILAFEAMTGAGLATGVVWSCLAFVNVSVSVLMALIIVPVVFVRTWEQGTFGWFVVGMSPGILKHATRTLGMFRSGFLSRIATEQSRLWKLPLLPTFEELLWWVPFAATVVLSTAEMRVAGAVLVITAVGLHWANFRVIYLFDQQSCRLAFWTMGVGCALASRSIPGLIGSMFLAYSRPASCGVPFREHALLTRLQKWSRRALSARRRFEEFPALAPMALPRPLPLMAFLGEMPDRSRIIVESDGDPREVSRLRGLKEWSEEFLPGRNVDIVNEPYARLVEPELAVEYLNRFSIEQMSTVEMDMLCSRLGASYVVAYSQSMIDGLVGRGWSEIARVDMASLPEFTKVVPAPAVELVLLRAPFSTTVIEPFCAWSQKGNALTWSAERSVEYVVKYRYAPEFRATQNGRILPVLRVRPIEGIPLEFMQVESQADLPIELRFHPRWV